MRPSQGVALVVYNMPNHGTTVVAHAKYYSTTYTYDFTA